jgi:3-hydroxyacyl-CoA dehydrogenase
MGEAAEMPRVAVACAGVIGRAWIKVFARAGCRVAVHDANPAQAASALDWLQGDVDNDVRLGLIDRAAAVEQLARVSIQPAERAFEGVAYVQESGPENVEAKREIVALIDRLSPAEAIIGSSTSAIDVNDFAGGLPGAGRVLTVHPIAPPSLNPAVEVYPSRAMAPATLEHALGFLRRVGMAPVLMQRFVYGYIAARLQAALMREAINLVDKGYATLDGIDTMVREGLGQRWAFLGPFGVNHLNADGGVGEYYAKYAETYRELMATLFDESPAFDAAMAERFGGAAAETFGTDVLELRRWRDEQMKLLRANKERLPMPTPKE